MKVRIYKRGTVIRNTMFFMFMSVIYLHVVKSLENNVSAFKLIDFTNPLSAQSICLFAFLIILPAIALVRPASRTLSAFFLGAVIIYGQFQFFERFDKGILILNLLYILSVFYFYILWHLELKQALYGPMFTHHDLGLKSPYRLKTILEVSGKELNGYLTNWDQHSCFLVLDDPTQAHFLRNSTFNLKFMLDGKTFSQSGVVVSEYGGSAYGIAFRDSKLDDKIFYKWSDFYTIICDRGYIPNYMGT